jgi:hypothetical protein
MPTKEIKKQKESDKDIATDKLPIVLSWAGLGCSLLVLLTTLCPGFVTIAGMVAYVGDPSNWYKEDNEILALFSGSTLCGLLFATIIGGISLFYIIKRRKNKEEE